MQPPTSREAHGSRCLPKEHGNGHTTSMHTVLRDQVLANTAQAGIACACACEGSSQTCNAVAAPVLALGARRSAVVLAGAAAAAAGPGLAHLACRDAHSAWLPEHLLAHHRLVQEQVPAALKHALDVLNLAFGAAPPGVCRLVAHPWFQCARQHALVLCAAQVLRLRPLEGVEVTSRALYPAQGTCLHSLSKLGAEFVRAWYISIPLMIVTLRCVPNNQPIRHKLDETASCPF